MGPLTRCRCRGAGCAEVPVHGAPSPALPPRPAAPTGVLRLLPAAQPAQCDGGVHHRPRGEGGPARRGGCTWEWVGGRGGLGWGLPRVFGGWVGARGCGGVHVLTQVQHGGEAVLACAGFLAANQARSAGRAARPKHAAAQVGIPSPAQQGVSTPAPPLHGSSLLHLPSLASGCRWRRPPGPPTSPCSAWSTSWAPSPRTSTPRCASRPSTWSSPRTPPRRAGQGEARLWACVIAQTKGLLTHMCA